VKPTAGYYIQKLFGHHSGNEYISGNIIRSDNREDIRKRVASSFVIDSQTNDLIIKLVNLLPVPVSSSIDLSDFNIADSQSDLIVMKGQPADRDVKPEASTLTVSAQLDYELPAYSFSIIRIKTIIK
jgi:alpha-L-arabinofuranosidase